MHFTHKASLALALPLLFAMFISHSVSAQTIGNAGFETPFLGSGNNGNYVENPANAGWTFEDGFQRYSGISGNGSGFTGGNPNAPEGSQVAFLQQEGAFSEAITGFAAGDYVFQFEAAQRVSGAGAAGGGFNDGYSSDLQNFQVLIDGTALYGAAGLTPTVTVGGTVGGYQLYTTDAVALAAGTHMLTFQGLNTAYLTAGRTGNEGVYDNTAFIDAVEISPAAVPEAATAVSFGLLLVLGLGGVAVTTRRRKAQSAD